MFVATPWQLAMQQLPGRSQAQLRVDVQLTLLLEHCLKILPSDSAAQPAQRTRGSTGALAPALVEILSMLQLQSNYFETLPAACLLGQACSRRAGRQQPSALPQAQASGLFKKAKAHLQHVLPVQHQIGKKAKVTCSTSSQSSIRSASVWWRWRSLASDTMNRKLACRNLLRL